MKKKLSFLLFVVLFLGGCAANTGIVKISDDTFMMARQSGWEMSGSVIKAELYQEANDYCAQAGKKLVQVSSSSADMSPFTQPYTTAEIQFKCQ